MNLVRLILVYVFVASVSMPVGASAFMRCGSNNGATGHNAGLEHAVTDTAGHHGMHENHQGHGEALDSNTVDCQCCKAVCGMAGCAFVAAIITPFLTFELSLCRSHMALREANPSLLPPGFFRPPIVNA